MNQKVTSHVTEGDNKMNANDTRLRRSRLSAALLAALLLPAGMALAQDADQSGNQESTQQSSSDQDQQDEIQETQLEKVVVTGSLIPQSQIETFQPVTTVTAEAIDSRGFADVHDVLIQSSFATGRVQGNETDAATFTKGAVTLSMFGLSPSYTKYLINGVPMVDYPALYNGSDTFNNISGIPTTLVERIDILPGGQSSIYGSDAIAGVVNVITRKNLEGGSVGVRYGWYDEGGGESKRLSLAYGDSSGDFSWLAGVQWEKRDPVWAYERELTKQFNPNGYSTQTASRDYLVYGPFTSYVFKDPNNCANVASQFGGTTGLRTREGRPAPYCGSFFTPGYRTLINDKDSKQVYLHGSYDLDNVELYGDFLYSKEQVKYHVGAGYTFWATGVKWGYYWDPSVDGPFAAQYGIQGGLVNLQRVFSPEDMGPGGYENTMSRNDSDSYMVTLGARGTFGDSYWDWDASLGRAQYQLSEGGLERIADKIDGYFQEHVLGPQLGIDPLFGNYPIFEPDYDAFYSVLDPADYYSFMEWASNESRTYSDILRAQITNAYLFSLPGGDAGLAVVGELAQRGWDYDPDPRFLNGEIWGTTAVAGHGYRHRYALTSELRLPLVDMLTVTASGRYDNYIVEGESIDKPTYSVGLEFRPFKSLLFRGKYGTAFKAPTLSDQFQGVSGFYTFVPDYYRCWTEFGIDPTNIQDCQYDSQQIFGTQSGNPKLEPINADVWNAGVVWAPTSRFNVSVDYFEWVINDEVAGESLSGLLRDEYLCFIGELDPSSTSCQHAADQIERNDQGVLQTVHAGKINIAEEKVRAITAGASYLLDAGTVGTFRFSGSYTNMQEHKYIPLPGDEPQDRLNDPFNSTDPKVKGNASIHWEKNKWSATVYGNYIGHTPNNIAWIDSDRYEAEGAGKLDPYSLYNLSVGFHPTDDLDLALRVTNVMNKLPDMDVESYSGGTGSPYNYANFSVLGRRYYVQAEYRFGND